MSAEVAHQLSIFVANKPGVLGKVCELLKKEKINIYAITTSDNRDYSLIRLVVDEPRRALDLLGCARYSANGKIMRALRHQQRHQAIARELQRQRALEF